MDDVTSHHLTSEVQLRQDDVTWASKRSSMKVPFEPWESPDDLLDYATSDALQTIINVGFLPVIVCIGVIGNVINAFIFAKQGLQDRINVCLFSLALADCGCLLALMTRYSFSLLTLFSKTLGSYWKVRNLNIILGVFWGFSTVSNLLTMLVSVERCLCVVNPLKAKQLLKTKVMVVLIVLIYVLVISGSLIVNVKYTVGITRNKDTNLTVYTTLLSEFYIRNKLFVDVVYNYLMAIILPFTSLVIVVGCSTTTSIGLKRTLFWKQKFSNLANMVDNKETAAMKMLLLICYAYIIFVTPSVVNAFVVQFVEGWNPGGRYSNVFYVYVALMRLLTALNSSINFFIYYLHGSKFLTTFRKLCCNKKQQNLNCKNVMHFTKQSSFSSHQK